MEKVKGRTWRKEAVQGERNGREIFYFKNCISFLTPIKTNRMHLAPDYNLIKS